MRLDRFITFAVPAACLGRFACGPMIPVGIAVRLGVAIDSFLMAVGASGANRAPIGLQSNTLVIGPGGCRFGDHWRIGLPLDVSIVAVVVPMIRFVWPM